MYCFKNHLFLTTTAQDMTSEESPNNNWRFTLSIEIRTFIWFMMIYSHKYRQYYTERRLQMIFLKSWWLEINGGRTWEKILILPENAKIGLNTEKWKMPIDAKKFLNFLFPRKIRWFFEEVQKLSKNCIFTLSVEQGYTCITKIWHRFFKERRISYRAWFEWSFTR